MATSHEHHRKPFLPPSPPPSPPSTRRRTKKHHDNEFAKLAATPLPSPTLSTTFGEDDEPEPLWKRIILTPLLFTSFLLSLFLVNARDRARRSSLNTPLRPYLSFILPSSWRLDPEPYQDQHGSTWGHRGKTTRHVGPDDAVAPKEGQLDGTTNGGKKKTGKGSGRWHLNKKIRKIARLEVSDAFEGQGRMLVVMAVGMALSLVGFWVVVRWAWRALVGGVW